MKRTAQLWTLGAGLVATAFALRTLSLIDATALWSDELYSVGKSFQPSLGVLLDMLRQDTHPPLYYMLLWIWGQLLGQTPVSLRLLSWLAYLAGGSVMVAQAVALGDGRQRVLPLALLLAFCSPYPVRFAIEGKSYALLVLLVALAWWWRRSERPVLYGLTACLAGLTHFYGLFLMLSAAAWDGTRRRWRLAGAAVLGAIPALGWIVYSADYLLSSRSGSWIGPPDFALLEESLARALGLWPLPKLLVLVVLIWGLQRWGGMQPLPWRQNRLLDRSALLPSAVMVLAVVVVSFVKPLAFSRYFVVASVGAAADICLAHSIATSPRRPTGGAGGVDPALDQLVGAWFCGTGSRRRWGREQDQFRAISQLTDGERIATAPGTSVQSR